MNARHLVFPWLLLILALLAAAPALALDPFDNYDYRRSDLPGGADHPALGRVPGAVLDGYQHYDNDVVGLPGGQGRRVSQAGEASGETWMIHYRLPDNISPRAAASIYRRNLEDKGLEVVWSCNGLSLSGQMKLARIVDGHRNAWVRGSPLKDMSCVVAKGSLDGRPTTVSVYTYKARYFDRDRSDGNKSGLHPAARLYIVQGKALDTRLEVVKADEMARSIDREGKVALYGIHFDVDSDRIRPESRETIREIARLLKAQPDLRLFVVGHTDSTGSLEHNMDLSRRRAASVTRALVQEHGIAAARLSPHGVGPLAPLATNATEEGRARNRRVELVRQ